MKATAIYTLLIAASLSLPVAVSAQTSAQPGASGSKTESTSGAAAAGGTQQYGEGGSKHCDELTGAEKQQCMQDEGAKTESKEEPAAAAPGAETSGARNASSGETAPDAKGINATQTND
jgi:hypothetical protein